MLFCIFAFGRDTLLHSNSSSWVDIIWLHWLHIGGSVFFFFLIDTHVQIGTQFAVSCFKPPHNYFVFLFQVVGRHYLVEILGFMCFCLFFFLEVFHILFHNCFSIYV